MNKKILTAAAIVVTVLVATVGITMANEGSNPSTKSSTNYDSSTPQSAPDTTATPATSDTVTQSPTTSSSTAVPTTASTTPTSTADANKAKLQQAVTDLANKIAQALNFPASQQATFAANQWACVDKLVSHSPGYDDYNAILSNSAFVALTPTQNDDGTTTYHYFDNPGTCRIVSPDPV